MVSQCSALLTKERHLSQINILNYTRPAPNQHQRKFFGAHFWGWGDFLKHLLTKVQVILSKFFFISPLILIFHELIPKCNPKTTHFGRKQQRERTFLLAPKGVIAPCLCTLDDIEMRGHFCHSCLQCHIWRQINAYEFT